VSHDHGSKKCKEIFARLSEYLDGELDPSVCDRLEGHLGDCPPCQAFLESLRRTVRLVGSLDAPELDEAELQRLVAACRRQLEGLS
jgi:anti-sigma factor RsiW